MKTKTKSKKDGKSKNGVKPKNGTPKPNRAVLDTAKLREDVLRHVVRNPGRTAEKIAVDLRVENIGRLGRVLRKLRASKMIKGKGATRAMAYTATAKAL